MSIGFERDVTSDARNQLKKRMPRTPSACRGTRLVEVTFLSGLNADLIAIDCGFDSDFLFSGDLQVVCFHILIGNRKVLVFEFFKDRAVNIQRDVYVRVP